jgi:hypothetical protein
MPLQSERDHKNALRFYLTLPEGEVRPVPTRQFDHRIATAEKQLALIKTEMAKSAAAQILTGVNGLKQQLPTGQDGDAKPYHIKRPAAGTTAAHYRVGLQVTFTDPHFAERFAKWFGLA